MLLRVWSSHPLTILIVGDPHGDLSCVLQACRERQPTAVILVGDQELQRPLVDELAPLYAAAVPIFWLVGNHDADSSEIYDNLVSSVAHQPDGHLGARAINVDSLRIGGLSGVFANRVWYPQQGGEVPRYATRADYLRSVLRSDRWRSDWSGPEVSEHCGLPRSMRAIIFPEDLERLAEHRLDVIISHEAPGPPHPRGFGVLARLADRVGARLWVHGHHHRHYDETVILPSGRPLRVVGLGIRQCWWLD